MKNTIVIFFVTLGITLFYNYVGQLVPQKRVYPPADVEVRANMTTDEMIAAGQLIVEGKGTCLSCHNGSARFPVLDGIGARAGKQREGLNDVDYLAESLYDPNVFIVPPFAAGMPPVNKPPIGLNDQEILTVIAYLQSLGGTPTVTMETKLKYQGSAPAEAAPAATGGAPADGGAELDAEGLMAKYACATCHSLTTPDAGLGPSLMDVGKRLSKAEIYEAIMDPDATIAAGFAPGVMTAMLEGAGFYKSSTPAEVKKLVNFLAEKKG